MNTFISFLSAPEQQRQAGWLIQSNAPARDTLRDWQKEQNQ